MDKFERRQLFEGLCHLRALYRLRGERDATSTISIDDVIAYAERLMDEPDALALAIGTDEALDATAPASDSAR